MREDLNDLLSYLFVNGTSNLAESLSYDNTSDSISENTQRLAKVLLALMSMTGSIFVAITIFYSKKLQVHPQPLIAYICLCEAISSFNAVLWSIGPYTVINYFKLNMLFSRTFFFQSNDDIDKTSLTVLCYSNEYTFQYFQLLSLILNMCLCIDLVLTLRNPFYPSKRRMKFYLVGSMLLTIVLVFLTKATVTADCVDQKKAMSILSNELISESTSNMILSMTLSVYILIALYSCVYAQRRLQRPGISPSIRKHFLYKHYSYVSIFIIIWTFYLASAYYQLFYPDRQGDKSQVVVLVSQVAAFSTGVFLTLVRLFEPYFMFLVKKKFFEFFGKVIAIDSKANNDLNTNTLNSFLTSSLNVELVNIILQSIVSFSKKSFSDHMESHQITEDMDHFNLIRKMEIPRIEIDNADLWDFSKKNANVIQPIIQQLDVSLDQTTNIMYPNKNSKLIINEGVEIYEYAGFIFQSLRKMDSISNEAIINSLSPEANREMIFKAGEGQGKSGSFFFFSHDRKFIIKTMTNDELEKFKKMFKDYYEYLSNKPGSILARIYGIFTVMMEDLQPINLILMGNTMQCDNTKYIENIFDLKGSLTNRKTKGEIKNTTVLKDLNLRIQRGEKLFLKFQKADRRYILDIIESDVRFLMKHNLMDYSLLFAIENNAEMHLDKNRRTQEIDEVNNEELFENFHPLNHLKFFQARSTEEEKHFQSQLMGTFVGNRHKYISFQGKYVYHLAIIDYLQDFNINKQLECKIKNFKSAFVKNKTNEISCIPPGPYAKRFFKFMRDEVIIDDKEKHEDRMLHSFIAGRETFNEGK